MGIFIEFSPELCLRNVEEFKNGNREKEECFPENLEEGKIYEFIKKDQKNFFFHHVVPLRETKGAGNISRPKAGIQILEATHFLKENHVWTRGKYKVIEIFKDDKIYFEGLEKVGTRY